MKAIVHTVVLVITVAGLLAANAFACTTFCLKNNGEVLFGRNYDWMIGDGVIFVNKRGVSKRSVVDQEKNQKTWVSSYGSVTFNQYGRENPMGGMNEIGLVIELMWLDGTRYPAADERPAVDVLEWIQFNLDTAATTAEVLANAESVRISSSIPLHYLVNDRAGNTATVEFLEGKLVYHSGNNLPVAALANDTYARSIDFSRKAKSPLSESSLDRFSRAAEKTAEFGKQQLTDKPAVDYAFEILNDVAQRNSTQWSVVYDQKRGRIYYRTRLSRAVKLIDARAFDFSCGSPVRVLDMNADLKGDVTSRFREYTRAANRDLIERSYNGTPFLKDTTAAERDLTAAYPEAFVCSVTNEASPKILATRPSHAVALNEVLYLVFPPYYVYKQIVSP
jgi:choloylglycine hydrolase